MKKTNAYQKIQFAKKQNERIVLSVIRAANLVGEGYRPMIIPSKWRNAIHRLKDSGRIRYKSKKVKYYIRSGYWVISNKKG